MRKVSVVTREQAYQELGEKLDAIFEKPYKRYIIVDVDHRGSITRFTIKNWIMAKIVYGIKYRIKPW